MIQRIKQLLKERQERKKRHAIEIGKHQIVICLECRKEIVPSTESPFTDPNFIVEPLFLFPFVTCRDCNV
jgi:hypothetical protein